MKLSILIFLLTAITIVSAQIPNDGFETWSAGNPDVWTTSNITGYTNITQSIIAHSGTSAVRGEVIQIVTFVLQPVLQSGVNARGFAYNKRPTTFNGFYQFFPAAGSGDRFAINTVLFKNGSDGTGIATAAAALSAAVSSYTQFNAPFVYLNDTIPDTCVIQFQIVGPGTGPQATPHVGSYFIIDDLSFDGLTGIVDCKSLKTPSLKLRNSLTTIIFSVPDNGKAVLHLLNIKGMLVAKLFDCEALAGKEYHTMLTGLKIPTGIYCIRLESCGRQVTEKLTLFK